MQLGGRIMSDLKDFNWTGFWNDVDYAFESYIGKPVTDKDIKDAESELGYTLPAAYIELLNNHNGGVLNKNCFINNNGDCVYVTGIYGIDRDKKNSIFGKFGNEFWISKWEYPPIGIVVADTISAVRPLLLYIRPKVLNNIGDKLSIPILVNSSIARSISRSSCSLRSLTFSVSLKD